MAAVDEAGRRYAGLPTCDAGTSDIVADAVRLGSTGMGGSAWAEAESNADVLQLIAVLEPLGAKLAAEA